MILGDVSCEEIGYNMITEFFECVCIRCKYMSTCNLIRCTILFNQHTIATFGSLVKTVVSFSICMFLFPNMLS